MKVRTANIAVYKLLSGSPGSLLALDTWREYFLPEGDVQQQYPKPLTEYYQFLKFYF